MHFYMHITLVFMIRLMVRFEFNLVSGLNWKSNIFLN